MKTNIFLPLLFLFAFAGCEESQKAKVLSKQEVAKVLSEIYLAEEKVQRIGLRADSSAKLFGRLSQKIEEKTGIPDSVFRESLRYYMERPNEMEQIYAILVDSLNLMEQRSSAGQQE